MNIFKRFALFLYGIAGIGCIVTLALPWFGPWTRLAASFLDVLWYRYLVLGLLGITAVGVLASLCRALFTPRNSKTVVVSKANGDQVTVTTAAISSQASHIIEANHDYFVEKVQVRTRGRGKVNVTARVRPAYAIDIAREGKRLHDELMSGLATICGTSIKRVELQFVEPDSLDPKPEYLSVSPVYETPTSNELQAIEPARPSGITIPMGWASASSADLEASVETTTSEER